MDTDSETTEAEIEAGANALAQCYFLYGEQWPLSRFPEGQQKDFRDKATAVLLAAMTIRTLKVFVK